ncbi:MAG: flotillin family protein [Lachnospiraceae bacterium]|nr:flotillin family protein [Lachnospiraceae bacterium]
MTKLLSPIIIKAIIALLVIVVLAILASGYVKAPPDMAYIISGFKRKPKILIGRAGIKIPFLERKDVLSLRQISIDIKTNGYIPTQDFIGVDIDAVAKVAIMRDEDGIQRAMQNFLNMKEQEVIQCLTDSLQGNMREIIGTVTLKELCTDRKKFGDEVQEKAQQDMNRLGIQIISCNIQKIEDERDLINALGQDNMSQIQKDASIAKANAERDVAIATANAQREANEAKVASDTEIAQKQNELEIKKSELKREADIKRAEADAAYKIQEEEQRKSIEITTANANLAKQEKEIELKAREVEITEKALEAEIKKKAEADKYAAQQRADAQLYTTQKQSEAQLYERQKKAEAEKFEALQKAEATKAESEAHKVAMENEAAGIKAKGEAEAAAIQAKAEAEAAGILKKAEAMKQYGDAARQQMELDTLKVYFEQLPAIAQAVAAPMSQIDHITMYGEGNTAKLTGDMTKTIKQVTDGIKDSTGIDPLSLLVGAMGTKMIDKSGTMAQSAAAGALAQDTVKNEQTSVKKKKAEPEGE